MNSNENIFDRLPDDVVFLIFSKLQDAKSLCLSMSVCRRFQFIVPRVSEVFLPIPRRRAVLNDNGEEIVTIRRGFMNPFFRILTKPFHFVSQIIKFKSRNAENDCDSCSYYEPNDVLKPFEEIRALHLRIPCHVIPKPCSGTGKSNSKTFLRWKADFGDQLRSCVMLGAKSWTEKCRNEENFQETVPGSEHEQRVISDGEMKLRIVWTISCLIAASARHYMVQETVKSQKMIETVVVSDESDQGWLCMNKEQIEELKVSGGVGVECRSRLPALRMKMWYSEKMELPGCGKVMDGATLVVIWSAGNGEAEGRSTVDLVRAAFGGEGEEKVVGDFARKLVGGKKCYVLEMNSF
ncbi:F-box protein At1g30200-like [Primulina eburnea]|uniref:F-box protein At1g30200-like n=1 Tax=Primulina eburnea TaxID=1245227 RepID=UPI003C6C8F1E